MLIRSDESERACVVLDLRVENIEVFTTNHDVVWGFYFLFHFVFCRCLEKLEDVPFRFYIFVYFLSWLGLRFASCFSARLRQLCRFCLISAIWSIRFLGLWMSDIGNHPIRLWKTLDLTSWRLIEAFLCVCYWQMLVRRRLLHLCFIFILKMFPFPFFSPQIFK